jgi:hypothetical protein
MSGGKGGEMTHTLYSHMNKRKIFKKNGTKRERGKFEGMSHFQL